MKVVFILSETNLGAERGRCGGGVRCHGLRVAVSAYSAGRRTGDALDNLGNSGVAHIESHRPVIQYNILLTLHAFGRVT